MFVAKVVQPVLRCVCLSVRFVLRCICLSVRPVLRCICVCCAACLTMCVFVALLLCAKSVTQSKATSCQVCWCFQETEGRRGGSLLKGERSFLTPQTVSWDHLTRTPPILCMSSVQFGPCPIVSAGKVIVHKFYRVLQMDFRPRTIFSQPPRSLGWGTFWRWWEF